MFLLTAAAEEIELSNGVLIQGKLSETPKKNLQIQLAEGVTVEFSHNKAIRQTIANSEIQEQYFAKVPFLAESVETHLKAAEVCQAKNLNDLAKRHYQRILELDADQPKAREMLGYRKLGENWVTRDEEMLQQGYVQTKHGGWTTRQNQLILENKIFAETNENDAELTAATKNLIEQLKTEHAKTAEKDLLQMSNPAVVKILSEQLKNEQTSQTREILIRVLGKIGTSQAFREIAAWSIQEPNEQVCKICISLIKERPSFSRFFYPHLRSNDNKIVNRAAFILGELGDRAAIPLLIDSLVTNHLVKIIIDDRTPGARTNNGNLMTEEQTETVTNRDVLNALNRLTKVDFGYNIPAWRKWWEDSQIAKNFDSRRGSVD